MAPRSKARSCVVIAVLLAACGYSHLSSPLDRATPDAGPDLSQRVSDARADATSPDGRPRDGLPSTCSDGIKDGTETDVDCGGGACSPCAMGRKCLVGTDCVSSVCTGGICG